MRRRPIRRMPRVNDVAGVSESIPFEGRFYLPNTQTTVFQTIAGYATGQAVYYNTDIQLSDFVRAANVAANYQFFKLKYLELKFLPDADTFVPGGAGGVNGGKPYLYYMIDKGDVINVSLTNDQLKRMGAKPIALDEKPITIRWRPGVSLSTEIQTSSGTTSAQMYKVSPWLNTDENPIASGFTPSQVVHNGIKFFVENSGTASYPYRATLTAHFAFKKPLYTGQELTPSTA